MSKFEQAMKAIDEAHALDPTKTNVDGAEVPYELHYAQKSTSYLSKRLPDASEPLQIAVRAQHFRRWETPRSEYPMTKAGYFAWRTNAKKRQAQLVEAICLQYGYSETDASRVGAMIRKEDLKVDQETQALEDVACLVFLDDQFADFLTHHDEEKIVGIVRKTWGKMSDRGKELALEMRMDGKAKELVGKALAG